MKYLEVKTYNVCNPRKYFSKKEVQKIYQIVDNY